MTTADAGLREATDRLDGPSGRLLGALLSPAGIFLASRAAVWALAALLLAAFHRRPPDAAIWKEPMLHDVGRYVDVWGRWDGTWYTRIAAHGYGVDPNAPAFHPLYPLLVAGVGRALGSHYLVAGICVSLAAGAAAFELLWRWATARVGERAARRTLVFLALFPASLFLNAVYTESLFLLLAVATFLLAERGRIAAAAGVCGLALLTRPSAVALLPPLVLFAWRAPERGRALASTLLAPIVFALYPLVLWIQLGSPLRSVHAQENWERSFSLTGLYDALRSPAHDLLSGQTSNGLLNVEGLAYFVVFVLLAVAVWRLLGAACGLFAASSLAVPVLNPSAWYPLLSMPRFGLVVFPFFAALALLADTPRRYRVVAVVFGLLLATSVFRWTIYQFYA